MVPLTVLLASALSILGGAVYALIGWRYVVLARQAPAQSFFALFWLGIGFYAIADGGWSLAVPLLAPPLALGIVILHLKILAVSAGFFGLVYYLAYLYTGRSSLVWPVLAFYVLALVVTTYSYGLRDPIGQAVGTWGSGLRYANPEGAASKLAFVLLFAPPLLAAIAYGALFPRLPTKAQRRRVLATSSAFAVFFGGLLLGWMTDVVPNWPLIEKGLGIAAALVVYASSPR